MSFRKPSRRDLLRGTAATGLFIAGSGVPVFARTTQDPPLPQGAAGKLTVIHRTEYFEAAQTAFRDTVTEFAAANNVELDISTTNPELFGDFMGKMTAAVKAGNPPDFAYTSNVSIPQMHLLDLVEDVTDVVDEAVSKYGNIMPGLNAAKTGQFDGRWEADSASSAPPPATMFRGDKLKEKGIDPATLKTFERPPRGGAGNLRSGLLRLGRYPEPERRRLRLPDPRSSRRSAVISPTKPARTSSSTRPRRSRRSSGSRRPTTATASMPPCCRRASRAGPTPATTRPSSPAGSATRTTPSASMPQSKRDNNPVFPNIVLLPAPKANNGDSRDGGNVGGWLTIFKGAPNVDLAKKLALDLLDPANFSTMSAVGGGAVHAGLREPVDATSCSRPIRTSRSSRSRSASPTRSSASPGRPIRTPAVDAIRAQGVVEQMVGNVISGRMAPADAVKDAHQKMVRHLRRRRHHAAVRPMFRRRAAPAAPSVSPRTRRIAEADLRRRPSAAAQRASDLGETAHGSIRSQLDTPPSRLTPRRSSTRRLRGDPRPRLEDRLPVRAADGR